MPMLPTPSTSHIDTNLIYEPAEDSFLLIDTISSASEIFFLSRRFHPQDSLSSSRTASPFIIEIGIGSGVIIAFITAQAEKIFGRCDILTLGTDINLFATQAAGETIRHALQDGANASEEVKHVKSMSAQYLSSCVGDLGSPLVHGSVDVILFNPPYVPTTQVPDVPSEKSMSNDSPQTYTDGSDLLALSWAGGDQGMEVTNRLLEQIPDLLNPKRGVAYFLLCSQNRPGDVMDRVNAWGNQWSAEIVGSSGKTAGWENLVILRIARV